MLGDQWIRWWMEGAGGYLGFFMTDDVVLMNRKTAYPSVSLMDVVVNTFMGVRCDV